MAPFQIDIPMAEVAALCQRYHVRRLALFGSVLREDFGPESDVNVLVEFEPDAKVGYFKLVAMQQELSDLLGREVDLLTPGALNKHFRQRVLDMAQVIYVPEAHHTA